MSEDFVKRTAIHESGHALISFLCGIKPSYLTIVSRGDHGGYLLNETDENNNWSNRKTRLVQLIKDCDFDVFGLNEYSANIKDYLEAELSSTYSGVCFNPYSPTGIDDSKKVEYLGILYKKSVFTLTEWHGFWQAADLESSSSMPAFSNDFEGEKQYYRAYNCIENSIS